MARIMHPCDLFESSSCPFLALENFSLIKYIVKEIGPAVGNLQGGKDLHSTLRFAHDGQLGA
jgi:hypothetical protein